MRSRLEARYAAVLDAHGEEWTYEPRAYANSEGQYLPDFELPALEAGDTTPALPKMFIEVRPTLELGMLALSQMTIIWDSEPDAALMVTMPGLPIWFFAGGRTRKWKLSQVEPWS